MDRQKHREYVKRGKTIKYKNLEKKFKEKYNTKPKKYLHKNLDGLMTTNPGKAVSILKKMGAAPGECLESNTFSLPSAHP